MLTGRFVVPAARGFTLIEMMIVVAIVGIVLALGMPSFNEWIQSSKVRGAADSILSGIQFARIEAVRRNAPVFFQLNPTAGELWRVGCVTVVAGDPGCPAIISQRMLSEGSLIKGGSSIVNITSTGGTQLVFDTFGRKRTATTNPANPADFARLDVQHATISTARPQRILVDAGGSARMCDPQLSAPNLRACP